MQRLIATPAAIALAAWMAMGTPLAAHANVITDWDQKAVAFVVKMPAYDAQRL